MLMNSLQRIAETQVLALAGNELLIVYGKAVDDKEVGIYIEGIYFGGVAESRDQADTICRECVNGVKGGTAIPAIIPIQQSLVELFSAVRDRFQKMERDMIETEDMLEAAQVRAKKLRKK